MPSEEMAAFRGMLVEAKKAGIFNPYPPDGDWVAWRNRIHELSCSQPVEPGVTFSANTLGGVEVELSTPEKLLGDTIVMYIHGGGFTVGNARASRAYASQLAGQSGIRVYSLTYRLAPEHPFPAAPDDCFAVYKALLEKYPQSSIALAGDSAGGTLVLVVTLMAKDAGIRLPSAVCSFSPVTCLAYPLPSRVNNIDTDWIIVAGCNEAFCSTYGCCSNLYHPYMSPLFGNYDGFPPLKLVADRGEQLIDDVVLVAEKAEKAGVTVDVQIWDNCFHAFATAARATPESAQVLAETANFIKQHS